MGNRKLFKGILLSIFGLLLLLSGALTRPAYAGFADRLEVKTFETVEGLESYYDRTNYHLDAILEGRYVVLAEIPEDFGGVRSVDRRKLLFQQVVLPLVYLENDRIHDERTFLKTILRTDKDSGSAQVQKLHQLMDRYEVSGSAESLITGAGTADTLLRRVRRVPPSLVLAQAATESGWGTSRFCLQGNNLFGQRTYEEDAPGMRPEGVSDGADFKVRKFSTLLESVRSYMNNLNTHRAYERFRELRNRGDRAEGMELVRGLTQYSERRGDYVESIQSLIKYNDFSRFDGVRP